MLTFARRDISFTEEKSSSKISDDDDFVNFLFN